MEQKTGGNEEEERRFGRKEKIRSRNRGRKRKRKKEGWVKKNYWAKEETAR